MRREFGWIDIISMVEPLNLRVQFARYESYRIIYNSDFWGKPLAPKESPQMSGCHRQRLVAFPKVVSEQKPSGVAEGAIYLVSGRYLFNISEIVKENSDMR